MCYICFDRNICLAIRDCESARYSNLAWTWYGLGTELVLFLFFLRKSGGKGVKDFNDFNDTWDNNNNPAKTVKTGRAPSLLKSILLQ